MTDWVTVPDVALREALKLAAVGLERNDTTDVPVALLDGLIELFRESGGCDHAVGICCCDEEQAVQELLLAKDGKRTCTGCGGEGFVWDKEKAAAAQQNADYADDWAGMVNCPDCEGKGIKAVGQE